MNPMHACNEDFSPSVTTPADFIGRNVRSLSSYRTLKAILPGCNPYADHQDPARCSVQNSYCEEMILEWPDEED